MLRYIMSWAETWALILPLVFLFIRYLQPRFMKPVKLYLLLALPLNFACDFISHYYRYVPDWLNYNTWMYNLHSITRFACFAWFFSMAEQKISKRVFRLAIGLFIAFTIVNFIFIEHFNDKDHISGNLLSAEAFLMLANCMAFYLALLRNETSQYTGRKDFWVVTGLSIFYVINFFVFLFYVPLLRENPALAGKIWNVHNVAYITLCIFIAKALNVSPRN